VRYWADIALRTNQITHEDKTAKGWAKTYKTYFKALWENNATKGINFHEIIKDVLKKNGVADAELCTWGADPFKQIEVFIGCTAGYRNTVNRYFLKGEEQFKGYLKSIETLKTELGTMFKSVGFN